MVRLKYVCFYMSITLKLFENRDFAKSRHTVEKKMLLLLIKSRGLGCNKDNKNDTCIIEALFGYQTSRVLSSAH